MRVLHRAPSGFDHERDPLRASSTSRPHDALFNAAFEHPDHAAGLLRSVLPESIAHAIEWNTRPLVLRLGLHEVHIYLLFEHLSTQHPEEPRRMLRYLDGIWARGRISNGRLPIVIPVLVYHVPEQLIQQGRRVLRAETLDAMLDD